MTEIDEDKKELLIQRTLMWCNAIRSLKNLEPLTELPKGNPRNPLSCPCGQATELHVGAIAYYTIEDRMLLGRLPIEVIDFIREFDAGQIPELIA